MDNSSLIVYIRTNDKYAIKGAEWMDLDSESLNSSAPFALVETVIDVSSPDAESWTKVLDSAENATREGAQCLLVTHLLGDGAELESPAQRPKELSAETPFAVFVNSEPSPTEGLVRMIGSAFEKPCPTFVEVECEIKGLKGDRLYASFRLGHFEGRHELALWLVKKQMTLTTQGEEMMLKNVVVGATRTTARGERDGRKTMSIPKGMSAAGMALIAILLDGDSHVPFAVKRKDLGEL
ncbi:MAG: hypothetical protein U5N86_10415 [Planctomycetota bacterium]|nr:hypothetical protein [Planctomycetota bacterium]